LYGGHFKKEGDKEDEAMSETSNKPTVNFPKIWCIYEMARITNDEKKRIRKIIKRRWNEYLKEHGKEEQEWEDLNESEQTYFICYYIKEKMIRECPDKRTLNKIEKNIDEYVSGTLLNAEEITKAWNESVSRIHELHCKAHDSEHIKKAAYKRLCRDMQAYDKNIPIPTYEYYAKNPLSVYDYAQNYYRSHIDTTPVIIRIIQQVLEKALGLQIDHYLIEECLSILSDGSLDGLDINNFDTFPEEYNEGLDMKKEDFEKVQKQYATYQKYKKMYQDLDSFYSIDYEKIDSFLKRAQIRNQNNTP